MVGAQRCGTSYLWELLESHPEITMAKPLRPEPKYFIRNTNEKFDLQAYVDLLFPNPGDACLFGEKSTSYLEYPEVAARLAEEFADAKIIVMLRNPINRAVSNYFFSKMNGLESLPIEEAFASEQDRIKQGFSELGVSVSPFAYVTRGEYVRYLRFWSERFRADSLILIVMEKFVGRIEEIQKLYSMLGVDNSFKPRSVSRSVNKSDYRDTKFRLPDHLRFQLANHYERPNDELARIYGVDISDWK